MVHVFDAYPTGRGRPRKNPLGIVSKEGVIYDCFACLLRLHKHHLAHIRNGEPFEFVEYISLNQRSGHVKLAWGTSPLNIPLIR